MRKKLKFLIKIQNIVISILFIIFSSSYNAFPALKDNQSVINSIVKKKPILKLLESTKSIAAGCRVNEYGWPYVIQNGEKIFNPSNVALILNRYLASSESINTNINDFIMSVSAGFSLYRTQHLDKSKWKEDIKSFKDILDKKGLIDINFILKRTKNIDNILNKKKIQASLLQFDYDYTYNNFLTKAPFSSAFSQLSLVNLYVIIYRLFPSQFTYDHLYSALVGYNIDIKDGGFTSKFSDGSIWFEEIPTNPPGHILNAQILSLIVIKNAIDLMGTHELDFIVEQGRKSLESKFYDLYNCDYYTRYDLHYKRHEWMFSLHIKENNNTDIKLNTIYISKISPRRLNAIVDPIYQLNCSEDSRIRCSRLIGNWGDSVSRDYKQGISPIRTSLTPFDNEKFSLSSSSKFVLEFPLEGEGDFGIDIEYFDEEKGIIDISIRDPHAANTYSFIKIGEIKAVGDKRWKTITIPYKEKFLTGYIGPVYHLAHFHLMKMYNAYFKTNFFEKVLHKYQDYIRSGTDPLLIKNIERIDIIKSEKTKSSSLISKDTELNKCVETREFEFDKEYQVDGVSLDTPYHGVYLDTVCVEYQVGNKFQTILNVKEELLSRDKAFFRLPSFIAKKIKITYSYDKLLSESLKNIKFECYVDPYAIEVKKIIFESCQGFDKPITPHTLLKINDYIKRNYTTNINESKDIFQAKFFEKVLARLKIGSELLTWHLAGNQRIGIQVHLPKKTPFFIDLSTGFYVMDPEAKIITYPNLSDVVQNQFFDFSELSIEIYKSMSNKATIVYSDMVDKKDRVNIRDLMSVTFSTISN